MKRIFLFSLSLVLLASCGGKTPETVENVVLSPDCTYPDSPEDNAPGWVCGEPVKGLEVSTVGIAERTSAGMSYQRQMAEADARVRLASQLSVKVQNLIKQYVETTGAGDTETVDRASSSVTRQLTDVQLSGSRFFTSRTSPNGTLYVLVGLDKELTEKYLTDSMLQSMSNDSAAWQKMQADKADEELTAAILNQ